MNVEFPYGIFLNVSEDRAELVNLEINEVVEVWKL